MPIFAIGEQNRSPDRDAFTARFCSRIDIHFPATFASATFTRGSVRMKTIE